MSERLSRILAFGALILALVPIPGFVACVVMSMLTWEDVENAGLLDASTLWAFGAFGFVIIGFVVDVIGGRLREDPILVWRALPGLDHGYVGHFAAIAGVRPRPWLIVGRALWIALVALVLVFVVRTVADLIRNPL